MSDVISDILQIVVSPACRQKLSPLDRPTGMCAYHYILVEYQALLTGAMKIKKMLLTFRKDVTILGV